MKELDMEMNHEHSEKKKANDIVQIDERYEVMIEEGIETRETSSSRCLRDTHGNLQLCGSNEIWTYRFSILPLSVIEFKLIMLFL